MENNMSKTIIIDNYDSFTYNLVQIVNEIQDEEVTVRRNNETTIEEVATFDHIILSPGPGLPEELDDVPDNPFLATCLTRLADAAASTRLEYKILMVTG